MPRKPDQKRESLDRENSSKESTTKNPSRRWQLIALVVAAVAGLITPIPPFLEYFRGRIDPEKQFQDKFLNWVVEESFGSSIYLAGFERIVGAERIIKTSSGIVVRLSLKNSEGDWIEQRSISTTESGIIPIRNLIPGNYKAELIFFENTLAREENINIGLNKSEFVRLITRGTPGRIRLSLVDSLGRPQKNRIVSLYSKGATIFREDSVGNDGISEAFWVPSLGIDSTDFYIAKVYESKRRVHLLGTSEMLRPVFKYTEELIDLKITSR